MKFAALRLIKDEHRSLAAVLRAAALVAEKALNSGKAPDFKLLHAVIFYLREFPERRHHVNEDKVLFARVRIRTQQADAAIDEIEEEHRRGVWMLDDLESALKRWEAGEPEAGPRFAEALRQFSRFYWLHMEKEESRILAVAEDVLTDEDWHAIHSAFVMNEDPMFGEDTAEEFSRLFPRIIRLASSSLRTGEPAN